MVEVQIFFEGLFKTIGVLAGDFMVSMQGLLTGIGTGIRDILSGLSR